MKTWVAVACFTLFALSQAQVNPTFGVIGDANYGLGEQTQLYVKDSFQKYFDKTVVYVFAQIGNTSLFRMPFFPVVDDYTLMNVSGSMKNFN
jgi:hypothetical protein